MIDALSCFAHNFGIELQISHPESRESCRIKAHQMLTSETKFKYKGFVKKMGNFFSIK